MTPLTATTPNVPPPLASQASLMAVGVALKALTYALARKGLLTHDEMALELVGGRTFVATNLPAALKAYDDYTAWLLT